MQKWLSYSSILFLLTACFTQKKQPEGLSLHEHNQQIISSSLAVNSSGLSKKTALLKTVHGNILIKFYPQKAPNTVTRILKLIQEGFYDGLVFHRVINKFVAQTGDPTGLGTGGSGSKLKAEFNDIQHIRGTIAMARAKENKDSADSQFYIALSTLPHLDKNYTVFAQVVEGLNLLGKIQQGDKILSFSLKDQ